MADPQRTHKASPKRKQEFRKKGDIALSRDAVGASALAAGGIALLATGPSAFSALATLAAEAARATDGSGTVDLKGEATHALLVALVPILVGAMIGAVVAIFGQLGWPPAWKGIGFDLTRISPAKNLSNAFGLSAVARRTALAIVKLAVVGGVVALVLGSDGFVVHPLPAGTLAAMSGKLVSRALWAVMGTLAALGVVDYLLARRRMTTQMKMTSEELRREGRESDGDPQVKGRRRQKMKELARRRMAAAVKGADVIVVNPTHYAVALRYTEGKDRAPLVVAKGIDEKALKIREIARAHGVPVLERPPLARALHATVKEGKPIPANLYKAVAEVLAYVYRLRRRG